ncbi:MAG: glycosyltransferase family 1 protein [Chloroflexi bacterium HGW-Chloroflexi-1]|nr:MAG: glycosyltransferase family 1 protein [Chloroflexi bacterium HGW-Chloroflexi-1]
MHSFILDARTATPHFPGIGRYVTNLARGLAPLLAPDERLTVLHDPAHPPILPSSEALQLVPVLASPFSVQQQWTIPRLLRGVRGPGAGGKGQEAGGRRHGPSSVIGRSSVVYHSAYYLMPYRPGVPTVLTVYDLIPLLFPEHSTARARLLFRWTTALALRAADRVIAISEATRRDLLTRFRLNPERVAAIPLAADPAFAPTNIRGQAGVGGQGSGVSRKYGLPERYVLYVGSNKPHKNLGRLVEAWRIADCGLRIADCGLVIAGAWDARYPEARERAQMLGLGDRVRWLGPVAEADLPALYAGATLFVFPSLYEGCGLPALEALACGAPVICSNVSSLPEVAGDAALLVDPLDVDALAAAIGRVLGDEALAEEMRQRGLRQAARFTWERTAQQTLAVYRAQAH